VGEGTTQGGSRARCSRRVYTAFKGGTPTSLKILPLGSKMLRQRPAGALAEGSGQ